MVPSQLERREWWVQQRDGEGIGGLCLVGQLNGVGESRGYVGVWCLNALKSKGGCHSDFWDGVRCDFILSNL